MTVPSPDYDRLRALPPALLKKLGADKPSTGALTALRKILPEQELFQRAADLPRARHKLRNKLLHAASSYADIPRAEMATARPVALCRMGRLFAAAAAAGSAGAARKVYELGCGAGADFCAFLEVACAHGLASAGMIGNESLASRIAAIDNDPFTAWCARVNAEQVWPDGASPSAGGGSALASMVQCADAAALLTSPSLFAESVLFLDPTRRKLEQPGTRAVNDWSACEPPTAVWAPWLAKGAMIAMKVAPAFDWRAFDPTSLTVGAPLPQIEAIEWHGEVHELTLWWNFGVGSSVGAFTAPDGAAGRRATVVASDPSGPLDQLRVDSLFVPTFEAEHLREHLEFADAPPCEGDILAIPAPAVLRLDLAPAVSRRFEAPAMPGQPHLFRIPAEQSAAAAKSLLIKTGRLVANLPAREQDLRRALNSELKRRRWQPQVLGVKGVPGIEDRIRQLEQHARAKTVERGLAPGVALITRVEKSHRVLFLEPL